jgi:hypothetical protein
LRARPDPRFKGADLAPDVLLADFGAGGLFAGGLGFADALLDPRVDPDEPGETPAGFFLRGAGFGAGLRCGTGFGAGLRCGTGFGAGLRCGAGFGGGGVVCPAGFRRSTDTRGLRCKRLRNLPNESRGGSRCLGFFRPPPTLRFADIPHPGLIKMPETETVRYPGAEQAGWMATADRRKIPRTTCDR